MLVRGGGDLASGVIHRLYKCGYQVLVLECREAKCNPAKVFLLEKQSIDGTSSVEGVTGRLIKDVSVNARKSGMKERFRFLLMRTRDAVTELEAGCTDRCNPCQKKSWNDKR